MKHTPGKWKVESGPTKYLIFGGGLPVAKTYAKRDIDLVNANLIISAPEMLEMVKEVIQYVEGNGLDKLPREEACNDDFACTLYYYFAKDLIAKVEGGAK